MSLGQSLQVVGGVAELLGLLTVMLGIAETRRAFTDRPPLVEKLSRPVSRVINRLFRRNKVVELQAADSAHLSSSADATLTVQTEWEKLSDREATKRLQEYVDRHEKALNDLRAEVAREGANREEAMRAERAEREALRRALEQRISEAAAGGLTLETWGAGLFALGVVLATVGAGLG